MKWPSCVCIQENTHSYQLPSSEGHVCHGINMSSIDG